MEPEEEPSSLSFELPSSPVQTDPSDLATYLSPFPALNWRDDFRALTDIRRQSICLIEEIRLHLEYLATWGWPPFPMLSLVLAALHTRGADLLKFDAQWSVALKESFPRRREAVVRELLRVHELARPLFVDPQRRIRVVQCVLRLIFEGVIEEYPAVARDLLARWSVKEAPRFALQFSSSARAGQIVRHGDEFLRGLERVTPERLQAELDPEEAVHAAPPEEVPELPPPAPPPVSLLAARILRELADSEEWQPATQTAGRLTGVLRMPRPVFRPDEAAGGGPADLSRQGELPQLLLSELAFDDDLLAVRIVRREALYRKQEIPPGAPASERLLLIDQGLRSWGLPRLRLLGAALAVAAGSPHDLHLKAFNLHAPGWTEIDWTDAKSFAATAGATGSLLHPGEILAGGLLESVAPLPWEGDIVLLTHEDAAADPEFRMRLQPLLGKYRFRRITVDRAGLIRWSEHQASGWKAGGSCRLAAVDRIAAATRPKLARHTPPSDVKDWPSILRLTKFPLRIPEEAPPRLVLPHARLGRFEISRQRRLLWWDRPDCGPREILRDLPRGATRFLGVMGTANRPIVTGAIHGHQDGRLHIFRYCPAEDRTQRFSYALPHPSLRDVQASCEVLYVVGERRLDLIRFEEADPQLGEWRFRSGYRLVGGAFVHRVEDGSLFEVVFDGQRTALRRLPMQGTNYPYGLVGAYHAAGLETESVVLVHRQEGVRFVDSNAKHPHPFPAGIIERVQLSRDRRRLRLTCGLEHADVDLVSRTIGPAVRSVTGGELDLEPFPPRRMQLVAASDALGMKPDGTVLLVRGGVVRRVNPDTLLLERHAALPPEIPYREPYLKVGSASETWGERKAVGVEFPDGSRILEDPLGALHFRSSDPHLTEAVLVPFEPHGALWLSRLTDAGIPYAFDPGTALDSRSAGTFLRAFARRALAT